MSQSGGGISAGEARSIAREEANRVKIDLENEIRALMDDIRRVGDQIKSAIEFQTATIIAGVTATTAAVVSTKSEISDTRTQLSEKLTLQLRSELQLELGRKLNVARSASAKFKQFFQDIRSRFEKSVEGVFINRMEYDERFNQIFDEYQNKIRTIGEHIFQIRDEIRLVESSSSQSPETIYSLPMEVDLYRLDIRSEELDQTVSMLEASRLQEIKSSLNELKSAISMLSYQQEIATEERAGLEALYVTSSSGDQDLLLAAKAFRSPGGSIKVNNSILDGPESDISGEISKLVIDALSARQQRPLQDEEYEELKEAIRILSEDGIISPDDAVLASAVVESRNVSIYI
jgi:hypothetical protein